MSALDRSRPPTPGPVREYDFPAVRRARLNGEESPRLITARHGDLPLVTAQVVVEGGAAAEPADQAGVARLTAEALEAGTEARDEEELAWALESLGIQLDTSTGWDSAAVAVSSHRDRLDGALALLAEVVRRPGFPESAVERMRDEQLAEILQRKKEPRALAADAAARFIFAEDVPYARPITGTDETVRGLGSDALRAFHAHRYRAGSATVVVTGAIDHDEARTAVSRHFGDWTGSPAMPLDFEVRARNGATTCHIVHRPGAVQSEIRFGHVGVDRHHPDYFPLLVMNTILGGAFTSRLNMSLRERHGFTYGARSAFAFRRQAGPFSVSVAVASDVTARAIEETWKEIGQLRADGPTDDELASARDYLRGVLPLRLQTTTELAARLTELAVYDLPQDYFASYRDRIGEVTRDDVHRVAREAVRPDAMAITIVGDAQQIEEPVRELGVAEVVVHPSLP